MNDELMQGLRNLMGEAADEINRLRAEAAGWIEQHARDSAELRSLCAARDEARQQRSDMLDDLLAAQSELAALRKRVEDAPIITVGETGMVFAGSQSYGKRVRLVVEYGEVTTTIVDRARDLAHRAHAGQVDKAGRPYIEHVARVAAAVADDPHAEAVAWLHDAWVNNPDFNGRKLPDELPLQCVSAIQNLNRHNSKDASCYYAVILQNPIALRVKLADIADNADEYRLALLDEKTAKRLREKYADARRQLVVEG